MKNYKPIKVLTKYFFFIEKCMRQKQKVDLSNLVIVTASVIKPVTIF